MLIVVGPSNHPPGTHEVAAGGRLLKHCIEAIGKPELKAEVVTEWPADGEKAFADVASVVFIGDLFPPEVMPNRDTSMKHLGAMMKRGCGIVCIHYATGLEAKHVTPEGDHPLLHWMGGYFATRCNHHKSVARVFKEATIEPTRTNHPVNRGWKPFTLHDEPYINNYFGKDGPDKRVTVLATAMLPPEKPNREAIVWATDRPDGGGVGVVMPHFYRNWRNDDLPDADPQRDRLDREARSAEGRREGQAAGVGDVQARRPGSGQAVKLVNQLMISVIMIANAEALDAWRESRRAFATMLDVVSTSSGSNYLMQSWLPNTLFSGNLAGGFSLDLLMKDLSAALRWAATSASRRLRARWPSSYTGSHRPRVSAPLIIRQLPGCMKKAQA